MAMNPMQKKSRNFFLLGMFITLILAGAAIGIILWQLNLASEKNKPNPTSTVYVLSQPVKSGANITTDMLTPMKVDTRMIPTSNSEAYADLNQMSSDGTTLIKYVAKIDISSGTPLTTDMITQSDNPTTDDSRTQDFNMIKLPVKLITGDYIDVRLTLPSGQDYLVLAKKYVVDQDSNTVWLNLTEDETLIMNNAIIESYIMTGSNLYATVYVDPGTQKKPIPTYPISVAVQQTMASDPNILQEAIAAYNDRVAKNPPANDRASVDREMSAYSQSKKTNVETGVQKSITTSTQSRLQYQQQLNAL